MALYHKWDVKNGFAYVLTYFSLIFGGLGVNGDPNSNIPIIHKTSIRFTQCPMAKCFFFLIWP